MYMEARKEEIPAIISVRVEEAGGAGTDLTDMV
jgi:hypothetical protein